jgi:1,4-dihydroxy-2-naphthoyl-CoA hydrolase
MLKPHDWRSIAVDFRNRPMSIWFKPVALEQVDARYHHGLAAHLGIRLSAIGEDWLAATLPVAPHTHQPMGILHGGASVVLAETVGSIAAYLCIDTDRFHSVGQEINASHLRSVAGGQVTGTARPLRLGKRSHVWQIEIRDDASNLTCVSRLTMAILPIRM